MKQKYVRIIRMEEIQARKIINLIMNTGINS